MEFEIRRGKRLQREDREIQDPEFGVGAQRGGLGALAVTAAALLLNRNLLPPDVIVLFYPAVVLAYLGLVVLFKASFPGSIDTVERSRRRPRRR
jgi:hypothetical protein